MAPVSTPADIILEQLVSTDDAPARRALIASDPSLRRTELISFITERIKQEVRVNTANAVRLADVAILIAEEIGNKEALAQSIRWKANALYAAGHNAAAVELHERAAQMFEATGNQDELARSLSTSIQPMLLLGHYERALECGERARRIFLAQGNTWRRARVDINIGNIFYRQDRVTDALDCYERGLQELLRHNDAEGIGGVLSNLAVCYTSLNRFAEALACYERARQHCDQNGMPLLVLQADYNIAYLHFLRGEYGRAIELLRAARACAKKAGDDYHAALCNLDLTELYLELNLSTEAVELAHEAHTGFAKLGMGYESAKALAFAAIACGQQGQAFEALQRFTTAREMFVREKNQIWPSLMDLYKALVLFNEGRLFEARRLCAGAADFFARSRLRGKAAVAELLMARISFRMGQRAEAARSCETALGTVRELESPLLTYQAQFLTGEVQEAAGQDAQAYDSFRRARQAMETLRGSLRGEELKIAFFKNKLQVYEKLVDLCLRRPPAPEVLEEAFGYIEQAKSRSLMDLLVQPIQMVAETDAGQSELVRAIRNLREELNWYYNLIEREQLRPEERSQERVQKLERQARARETDLMRTLMEATTAEAGAAGLQRPSTLTVQQIRAALPADTSLVEYFAIRDRIVAAVLNADTLQIVPITVQPRIGNLLRLLQFQMSKFRLDPSYVAAFQDSLLGSTQAHLAHLHQELIAPLANLLQTSHLVFVGHGLLHYVPFHALYDGQQYLMDRFVVSYAPSASVYALCRAKQANGSGHELVMGVADAQAPSINEEVEAVAAILPNAKLFCGTAASEGILRSYGPEARIVHIATHGYFRQDNPMFSSIRLGGSYLNLYDLYQLKLPAELLVLSGCATGLNVVAPGDELIGLARGLFQAGAKALVLSLWEVHDNSTAELMVGFYHRLHKGIAKDIALQGAMAEVRSRYPHPYHWAPFVLIGAS